MTQNETNRAVASVTGETVSTVALLGFSVADPDAVDYDPEPSDIEDRIIDWDARDGQRGEPLVVA